MATTLVRRLSATIGAVVLATTTLVGPAAPARAEIACSVTYTGNSWHNGDERTR